MVTSDRSDIVKAVFDAVGVQTEPYSVAAEPRVVERLRRAVLGPDANGAGTAADSRGCDAIAPDFLMSLMVSGGRPSPRLPLAVNSALSDWEIPPPPPFSSTVDGGGEWEFLAPVEVGDVITTQCTLEQVYEKQGSAGRMLFVVIAGTYHNQRGTVVAKSRGTYLLY